VLFVREMAGREQVGASPARISERAAVAGSYFLRAVVDVDSFVRGVRLDVGAARCASAFLHRARYSFALMWPIASGTTSRGMSSTHRSRTQNAPMSSFLPETFHALSNQCRFMGSAYTHIRPSEMKGLCEARPATAPARSGRRGNWRGRSGGCRLAEFPVVHRLVDVPIEIASNDSAKRHDDAAPICR